MTGSTRRIRVLIADDNRTVRRAIRLQLDSVWDIQVIGEATNGVDAVKVALNERADVVLMDIQMPGLSGVEATRELTQSPSAQIAVIVMTSFAFDQYVVQALDAGAVGYLLKSHDLDQLVDAIRAAAKGEAVISPRVTAPILREFIKRGPTQADQSQLALLTAAERRVVAALSSGITSNDDIALRLHVSVHTVKSQLQSALKKTGLADRTQLALWGARNGLDIGRT
ncbi:response regulator [Microbacterium fluvii]|uniref:Response regulator n=1 Tax=Microbacterium fluvii TaxID=415215 RepID=A0ABW2HKB8_9MICO|nr:response regulator transcription factor [Microbacterium fluvii]MCU4673751.1 response regulator transcription factor [Microbacterium fluvii]